MIIEKVKPLLFINSLNKMRKIRKPLKNNLSIYNLKEYRKLKVKFYLTRDNLSGFGITKDKEIINLFSIPKGRGKLLINKAKKLGNNLNCFEGYLSKFYKLAGFKKIKEIKNWTKGEPSIIYFNLKKG